MKSIAKRFRHLVRIAEVIVAGHVPGNVVVELRRTRLRRLARERRRRQRLDVELDRLRRVLRVHRGVGHHARHRIAHEAHLAARERGPQRLLHRRAVAVHERHDALVRPVARQVLGGVDRQHAGHARRFFEIDIFQKAMGILAAHNVGVRLPRLVQVVRIAPVAAQQRGVLGAGHRLPDAVAGDREGFGFVADVHAQLLQTAKKSGTDHDFES